MQKRSRFVTGLSIAVIALAGVQFVWSLFGFDLQKRDSHALGPYLSVFEDTSASLTIEDVLTPEHQDDFVRQGLNIINFGFSTSVFWVRMDIPHLAPEVAEKQWFLEAGRARMDTADLYRLNPDGSWTLYEPELEQRVDEYKLRYTTATFVVHTREGETASYLMRMNNRTAFFVPFTLWEPSAFIANVTTTQLLFGIFMGGMAVMFFYNVFVWFVVRDLTYFYYSMHLLGATVFQFIDFGRGHELFGEYAQYFDKKHIPFFIWWAWLFGMLFTQRFLELKTRHPVLNRMVNTLAAIACVCGSLSYLMPYYDSQLAAVGFSMIFLLFAPYLGFYSYWKGNKTALFFNIAWMCNISGYLVYSTVSTGINEANAFTVSIMPIGTLLEVALLSFALGHRIKQLEADTLNARRRSMANLTRFQSLFDNALEGMYQMDLNGQMTTANASMLRQLGYDTFPSLREDSKRVRKLLFPEPRKRFAELAGKGRLNEEVIYLRPDGTEAEAIHSAQLIRDSKGRPSHIEGTFVDITERREKDRADKERLRERREKELARLATDEKSDFLKKMSYEIRMPLSAIMGFSETLRVTRLPPADKADLINTVLTNGQTLLTLINDILDHSKIEAGKMPVETIKTDLFILIEKLQSVVERHAVRRGLHFELQHAFPLPREIHTDPTRLRQALENLCLYAVDATPQGQVTLNVGWHEESHRLMLTLQDGSKGLSEDELSHLFDVFGHNASGSRRLSGSGLGMVIARQLVDLMKGELEVKSRPRSGTTFTLLLPCQPPARPLWVTSRAPTIVGNPLKKGEVPKLTGHILVAEDNAVNQQLIQRVIRKTGAMVTVAPDGQKAIDETQRNAFDLILMDVNMPVMGGLEATQTLRRLGYTGPIYALTAEQAADQIEACLVAGCDGHLGKPLELEKFYTILAQHLVSAGDDAQQSGLH